MHDPAKLLQKIEFFIGRLAPDGGRGAPTPRGFGSVASTLRFLGKGE